MPPDQERIVERDNAERLAEGRQRVREQQQRAMTERRLPARFSTTVVGVSFVDGYPENVHMLEGLAGLRLWRSDPEPIAAELHRAPDNPADANAVEVAVPELGQRIGHIPANVASRLAPELDAGVAWRATVTEVRVMPGHPDRPGIDLRLERA